MRYFLLPVFLLVVFSPARLAAAELRASSADAAVVGAGGALWIGTELAKPSLAPQACRWCAAEVNPLDRAARQSLVAREPNHMALASDVGLFTLPVAASLLTLGAQRRYDTFILVAESLVVTANVNQATKFIAGRTRPYAQFHNDVGIDPAKGDDHLSFFSGHAASTFSLAAATYAWMREDRPEAAPYVGAAMLAGAAFTGYARIAADRHYLSDVVTGAVVGSLIGYTVIESHRVGDTQGLRLGADGLTFTMVF